jgi:hypothetical protein
MKHWPQLIYRVGNTPTFVPAARWQWAGDEFLQGKLQRGKA